MNTVVWTESYADKPLAKHYREKHYLHTGPPKLKLEIVDRETSIVNKKKSKKHDFY